MLRRRAFLLSIFVATVIFSSTVFLFNKKKPGFSIEKVRSPFEGAGKWAIQPMPPAELAMVQEIFSKNFNYLGSGAQSYAFLSEDGKYVLKFFKMKHLLPKKWLRYIPLPGLEKYRFNKIDKRILRKQQLFDSYKIAYENLKEETGLVYIHLNKSRNLKMHVKLYDRMRKCYLINLDEFEFVLQKKAQLVRDRISVLMQRNAPEEALASIGNLLDQVVKQCKKGYSDRDSGISHNYGFVGDDVIHFDVGRIVVDDNSKDPTIYQREILRVGRKIEDWISIHHPSLLPGLEEQINLVIDRSLED